MKIYILITLMLISVFGISQNSGIVSYKITYLDSKLTDEEAPLYFNQDVSFFETTASPNNTFSLVIHDTLNSKISKMKNTFPCNLQVYTDLISETMISYNEYPLISAFYIKENSNSIKWSIIKKTKSIGNYLCQKATCNFHGREYIVWFTKEIPISLGPWKFNGLPGLILEAYEQNNFIKFQFLSLDININPEINALVSDEYVTLEEYFKIFKTNVLKKSPDIASYGQPNVISYIDISSFTELNCVEK